MALQFNKSGTIAYFLYHLRSLPDVYSSLDTNRITVCYFCLSALDLMDALGSVQRPEEIIEWIYSLQCIPQQTSSPATATAPASSSSSSSSSSAVPNNAGDAHASSSPPDWGYANDICLPCTSDQDSCRHCGFLGSAFLGGQRFDQNKKAIPIEATGPAHGHVAMTYTALACLIILGDDLSRVAREPILASLSELQQEDGRFVAHHRGGESDCRFLYCSCAIAFMLGGVDGHVNVDRLQQYVRSCLSYDGGIGLVPGQESHGGSTYTALAGVGLCAEGLNQPLDVVGRLGTEEDVIARWCLGRQLGDWCEDEGAGGFQGRMNKVADTCYTFWVLGALQVMDKGGSARRRRSGGDGGGSSVEEEEKEKEKEKEEKRTCWLDMYDKEAIRLFLLDGETGTQDEKRGGFGKTPGALPDILHSYYGVCGLALIGNEQDGVLPLDATLSISERSRARLRVVQEKRGWL